MRFQLIGKNKGKLLKVTPQSKKQGQKDLQAAVKVRVRAMVANTALDMIYPGLREFYYESSNQAAKEQKQLDGIPVVTDLPQLKQIGSLVPSIRPENLEQTGSTLTLDYGRGGAANIVLAHAIVDKFKIEFNDGGMSPIEFDVTSTDVDHDTFGALCMLVNHDIEIELIAPEVVQEDIPEEEDAPAAKGGKGKSKKPKTGPATPQEALEAAQRQHEEAEAT